MTLTLPVTPEAALAQLTARADATRAEQMRAYHKVDRVYLGLANPQIDALVRDWRAGCSLSDRVDLAAGLWDSAIHEAMIAAAKLLTQARLRPDDVAVWALVAQWAEGFEGWAVSDHASAAGGRRLIADPSRLDQVEGWTRHPNMWTRRAALVMTLPWARLTHPKPDESAARLRILGWATAYVDDRDWFIQKAIAWWLRELSKHDPDLARDWIGENGGRLKAFARKEAARYLP